MPVLESVGRIGNPSHAGTRINRLVGQTLRAIIRRPGQPPAKAPASAHLGPISQVLVSLPVTKAWLRQLVLGSGTGQ